MVRQSTPFKVPYMKPSTSPISLSSSPSPSSGKNGTKRKSTKLKPPFSTSIMNCRLSTPCSSLLILTFDAMSIALLAPLIREYLYVFTVLLGTWNVSSSWGSLLNSTVAEPSGPLDDSVKYGAVGEETMVSRVGDVDESSLMASCSQLARIMIFCAMASFCSGISWWNSGSYVTNWHVVVTPASSKIMHKGSPTAA